MSLQSGTRLGPYEILSPIGAGGMGEVYKAKDTRLDRTVAIKVIPDHLAKDPERRERFEREARAVSSLNHPHICTLHDIGQHNGIDFIVMENIEGETLADRLKKGPLPLEQALQFGIQIADALDKAHRQGVVHRDLKPGNVMLTKPGVKLLDFGLAKLSGSLPPEGGGFGWGASKDSEQPTQQKPLTNAGAILGTVQYMSPEQLEGKDADTRTDIFAFGALLYEMVTGRRAFEGKSQASLIGAILKDEPPPVSELKPMTPPTLGRVIKRCLAKDPQDRWQTARDLMLEVQWVAEEGARAQTTPVVASHRHLVWGMLAAFLVGALVAAYVVWKPSASPLLKHLSVYVPSKDSNPIALSPDGKILAHTAIEEGVSKLYVRSLDQPEASQVVGTDGAIDPFFSPDGQWVGFFSGSTLKKVSVSGGLPTPIGEMAGARGASWGMDHTIVVGSASGIWKISESGGAPQQVTALSSDQGEYAHAHPTVLPSGEAVLFELSFGSSSAGQTAVVSLETGERRVLVEGRRPRFSPTGHVVFWRGGALWAAPFDVDRLELAGSPVVVLSDVLQGQYALAGDGTLVYGPGSGNELVRVDRHGEATPIFGGSHGHLRLSPDGRQLAAGPSPHIWIYDLARGTRDRLTFDGTNLSPLWTPDGKRIAFSSVRPDSGSQDIYWKLADGSSSAERLLTHEYTEFPESWRPDGKALVFTQLDAKGSRDIWLLPLGGDRTPEKIVATPFNEAAPQFSPDGSWLAYVSDESGRNEIYVQPYPGPGKRWRVSTTGGRAPLWSRDGRELFYARGQQLWTVPVKTETEFRLETPRLLFEGSYLLSGTSEPHHHYDVLPDGRFLVEKTGTGPPTFNVILNWFQELERLAPTDS